MTDPWQTLDSSIQLYPLKLDTMQISLFDWGSQGSKYIGI